MCQAALGTGFATVQLLASGNLIDGMNSAMITVLSLNCAEEFFSHNSYKSIPSHHWLGEALVHKCVLIPELLVINAARIENELRRICEAIIRDEAKFNTEAGWDSLK